MISANKNEYEDVLKEQIILMASATDSLGRIMENLYKFMEDLTKFSQTKNEEEIKVLKEFEDHEAKFNNFIDEMHNEIPELLKGLSNF